VDLGGWISLPLGASPRTSSLPGPPHLFIPFSFHQEPFFARPPFLPAFLLFLFSWIQGFVYFLLGALYGAFPLGVDPCPFALGEGVSFCEPFFFPPCIPRVPFPNGVRDLLCQDGCFRGPFRLLPPLLFCIPWIPHLEVDWCSFCFQLGEPPFPTGMV